MIAPSHAARRGTAVLLLCCAMASAATAALAAPGGLAAAPRAAPGGTGGTWVAAGPDTGNVVALAAAPGNPGMIYAASAYGFVARSVDGGATWSVGGRIAAGQESPIPGFNRIAQLEVDPKHPDIVFAAASTGLFRSTDAGASWTALAVGTGGVGAQAVAVAPSRPTVVYAVTFGTLYRSGNRGVTWKAVGSGQLPLGLDVVAVDRGNPARVYVGTDKGLWISTDSGAHWSVASGPAAPGGRVAQILVTTDSRVVVLADFPSGGVVVSADGGVTWRAAYRGLPSVPGQPLSPTGIARSGNGSFYVYYPDVGDVYRSNPSLRRWSPVASLAPLFPPAGAFPVLAFAADAGADVLYAGVDQRGVLRSGIAGSSWSPSNGGLTLQAVRQALAAPAPGGGTATLLLLDQSDTAPDSADEQVFASPGAVPPSATSWSEISLYTPFALDVSVERIAFDAQTGTLYAGTDSDVWSSTGGGPWTASGGGLVLSDLVDLAAAAGQTGHLFALGAQGPSTCGTAPCHTLTLFATTNGGASWSPRASTTDLDDPQVPQGRVPGQLALDPADPATLYLLAVGLYKTTDGGATVQKLPLPGSAVALVIDPAAPATLYAAVRPGAAAMIFKSVDGGGSWSPAAAGLPAGAQAIALAIDPAAPASLYLATDRGVFASADGGATWAALDQGLAGLRVLTLAVIAGTAGGGPSTVCAGTEGAGLFTLQPAP